MVWNRKIDSWDPLGWVRARKVDVQDPLGEGWWGKAGGGWPAPVLMRRRRAHRGRL